MRERSTPLTTEVGPDVHPIDDIFSASFGRRYALSSWLGRGPVSDVFRARDMMLDRDVAIKCLRYPASLDASHREDLDRHFIEGAKQSARLVHPHVVSVHDVVASPTVSFIVTDYVDGTHLGENIGKPHLTLEEALAWLSPVAEVLDDVHRLSLIHGNLKPTNILIDASGEVWLRDFGIALNCCFGDLPDEPAIRHALTYQPPEVLQNAGAPLPASDVYALVCILFELLSGTRPFDGEDISSVRRHVLEEPPRELDWSQLGLSRGLGELISSALAKSPAERNPSPGALIEALRRLPTKPGVGAECMSQEEDASTPLGEAEPIDSKDPQTQGSLCDTPLVDVIRDIYVRRKSGILVVQSEGARKGIAFQNGSIVSATSDVASDQLEELLRGQREIAASSLDLARRVANETGQQFGSVLVGLGHLSADGLRELVARQVQTIIGSILSWETGDYRLEPRQPGDEPEEVLVHLSTADTVRQAIRRSTTTDMARRALGKLGRVLMHSENPLLLYQELSLTPEEGFVLSRVDGATTVAETASISPLGEDETLRCIYGLVATGILDLEELPSTPSLHVHQPAKHPEIPRPETEAMEKADPSPSETDRTSEAAALREAISRKHASLAKASHYEVLEASPTMTSAELKSAYYAVVKKYHPDRHRSAHLKDLHGQLEDVIVRITTAYELLADPAERTRYDATLLHGPSEASSVRPPPSPYPATKSWDPLSSENQAERHFQEGKRHFDQNDFFDAIQCLQEAVRLNPKNATYHKVLGQALSKNPKWKKDAEGHLLEALKLDPWDAEVHAVLGEIYQLAGLATRAERCYHKALEIDPEHPTAIAKLRAEPKRSVPGAKNPLRGET